MNGLFEHQVKHVTCGNRCREADTEDEKLEGERRQVQTPRQDIEQRQQRRVEEVQTVTRRRPQGDEQRTVGTRSATGRDPVNTALMSETP